MQNSSDLFIWQIAFLNIFVYVYATSLLIIMWFLFIQIICSNQQSRHNNHNVPYLLISNSFEFHYLAAAVINLALGQQAAMLLFGLGVLHQLIECTVSLFCAASQPMSKLTVMSAHAKLSIFFMIYLHSLIKK